MTESIFNLWNSCRCKLYAYCQCKAGTDREINTNWKCNIARYSNNRLLLILSYVMLDLFILLHISIVTSRILTVSDVQNVKKGKWSKLEYAWMPLSSSSPIKTGSSSSSCRDRIVLSLFAIRLSMLITYISKYSQIFPNFVKYFQMLPNIFPKMLNIFKCFQIFLNVAKYFQMLPNISKCCQIFPKMLII